MKKYIYHSMFLFAALALVGGGCLSSGNWFGSSWFGGGSADPVIDAGSFISDDDAVFDLFEDGQDCDAIEKEYDAAASAGKDQATLDEIVKRHRACLGQ